MRDLAIQRELIHKMTKRTRPKDWIEKAVKHPGAVKNAARRRGISTHQEAERESHSSNKKTRARGILAKRFESGKI